MRISAIILIIFVMSLLTCGQTKQKKIKLPEKENATKQEIAKQIPIGSSINDAQRILAANGFRCVLKERTSFAEMNEDKSVVEHNNIDFCSARRVRAS